MIDREITTLDELLDYVEDRLIIRARDKDKVGFVELNIVKDKIRQLQRHQLEQELANTNCNYTQGLNERKE